MFRSARITLTFWYLLIIMIVSVAFSIFIYAGASREFDRIIRIQRFHIEHPEMLGQPPFHIYFQQLPPNSIELGVINDAKMRTLEGLIGINVFILLLSGFAGYFLAGQTLQPIQKMVDEQNQFITDASHELRTPLTALRAEIEVGLRNKTISLTTAKKLLESNLEEVISLQTLSDKLLELSSQIGQQEMEKFSLLTSVKLAIKTVESLAKVKQITIRNTVKNSYLQGVSEKVTEVFVILFDNAIKYSPDKTTITIASEKKEHVISVTIQDQGIGISQDDLPHLFDRFYRSNKSRSKIGIAGYGLGLSIAKKIIDMHHGAIEIASNSEKGTQVTVRFHQK